MNTFNLNRIKLLLLADWHEFKLHILLAVIAIPAIALSILFYNSDSYIDYWQLFRFTILISALFATSYAHNRANQIKGLGFLTPVSPLDKYLAIWTGMIIIVVVFILLYIIILSTHSYIPNIILGTINVLFTDSPSNLILGAYFYSFYFLGMIAFRKNAFLKTALIIGLSFLFIILIIEKVSGYQFVSYFVWDNYTCVIDNYTLKMENLYPGILALVEYKNYIISLLILVNIYVGYLKLKEKVQ